MIRHTLLWLFPILAMMPIGCATQGTARGVLESVPGPGHAVARPVGPVAFSWYSNGTAPTSGTMVARLPTGETFEGPYVESRYEPEGFGSPSADTPPGPEIDAAFSRRPCEEGSMDDEFMGRCTGHLLAELQADGGTRLWCDFLLEHPTAGPAGGGAGRCQLSNGEQIDGVELFRSN